MERYPVLMEWGNQCCLSICATQSHLQIYCSDHYSSNEKEATGCPPISDWTENLWYIYTGECHKTMERRKLTICDSMDGPSGYYAK